MLGHDLTETYSNKRLKLAGNSHMIGQSLRVGASEMFGPEWVTAVCNQYGLVHGQAMDMNDGVDFDLATDREKLGFYIE